MTALIIALSGLLAAQDDPPNLALFAHARIKMVESLKNQPNYVCTETIERSQRLNAKKRSQLIDILRFEIAFVEHHELYAWQGSNKFDERELWELAPAGGAISTGAFAVHAYNLFAVQGARFLNGEWAVADADAAVADKRMARFPFDVAQMVSAYRMRTSSGQWLTVAYHGAVLIDPAAELVTKMEIVASEIPIQLGIREAHTTIELGDVKIGDSEYRLPTNSVETISTFTGTEQRNDIRFSACRAYLIESKLSFGDPPPDEPVAAPVVTQQVTLPPDSEIHLELISPIDSKTSRTGDEVDAILAAPIKQNREILFDKKSRAIGRIVRLQRVEDVMEVEILFQTIIGGGKQAPFTAVPAPVARQTVPAGFSVRSARGGSIGGGGGAFTDRLDGAFLRVREREGAALIQFHGSRLILPKGVRSVWITTKALP